MQWYSQVVSSQARRPVPPEVSKYFFSLYPFTHKPRERLSIKQGPVHIVLEWEEGLHCTPHKCKTETFVWTRAAGSSPTDPSWHIPFLGHRSLNPHRSVFINMWFLKNTAKNAQGQDFEVIGKYYWGEGGDLVFSKSYLFFNNTNSQDCLKDISFPSPLSDGSSPASWLSHTSHTWGNRHSEAKFRKAL